MSSPTSMLSSSSAATSTTLLSTTLLSTTCPTEESGRLSQTSTAVATPCHPRLRAQSLRATIVGTDADLPDFEWEVFQTRDSLEIARRHIGVGPYQHLPVQRSRERLEAYPFGRDSLELVRGYVSRSQHHHRQQPSSSHQRRTSDEKRGETCPFGRNALDLPRRDVSVRSGKQQQQQQQHEHYQDRRYLRQLQRDLGVTDAQIFLHALGSRFHEDRAALSLLSDDPEPELDHHELSHRDSLELPREKRARVGGVAARRIAEMQKPKTAEKLRARAKAVSGKVGAAIGGVVGRCFGGGDDEDVEEKEGLIFG
jgi:hypothetical protein